jgi:ligand-binding sensor domain-containing protein
MIIVKRRLLPPLLVFLLLAACGGGGAPDRDQRAYEVADRFDVGSGIYVRALAYEGSSSTLWVGTSMGVMEIDLSTQQLRNTFTREHGLANEYVFAIGIDSLGYKWFGTNAGGASRYRDGEWDVFFPMHGLADYWIYAFAEQRDGVYWVGTWDGANRVDLETMEFTKYKEELINEWVYGLDVDSANRVWFGTEGGVSMFDGERWQEWNHANGIGAPNEKALPVSQNTGLGTRERHDLSVLVGGQESYNPNYVFATLADTDDIIWVGTWGGGVSRYVDGEWHNLSMKDGLAGNIVYSVAQDASGVYWFGTNRGLSRYDGKSFQNFDMQSGLPGQDVYAIAVTEGDDVWVGTRSGVARLAPADTSE